LKFLPAVSVPADRTLTDQVVRILRKGIVLGEFPPGSRLVELQLAEQLQVSRSTIREALRRLESESLIEISPHRGTRVAALTADDAFEICELHALLESQIVRSIDLPVSDELREELVRYTDAIAGMSLPADVDEFIEVDHLFHHAIVAAANRRRFEQVWTSMNSLIGLLVAVLMRFVSVDAEETAARHRAIVDAVSQPNPDVASVVISEHYRSMGQRTERALRAQMQD
jgi:GntR family transcriptional regulator, rspAB operon transcriptional repressor